MSLLTLVDPVHDEAGLDASLKNAIHSARVEGFPDLAQEMGLEVLTPQDVGEKASIPFTDEEVLGKKEFSVNKKKHHQNILLQHLSNNRSFPF